MSAADIPINSGVDTGSVSQERRRFLAIANPRGGNRRAVAVADQVKAIFADSGAALDVHHTQYAGHASLLAAQTDLAPYAGLCVIGGDGTTHEVVGGLMNREDRALIPLGLVPAGTGNTLHHHLECGEPLEAARRIVRGEMHPLDVVRVTMGDDVAHCINIVGWGAVADINRRAERWRVLCSSRYTAATLAQILVPKARRATIELDDVRLDGEFLFVLACNTRTTGAGMLVAPDAEVDDGRLDVIVLRNTSRWQTLKMFRRVFDGSHLACPGIEYHQVRSLAIHTESSDPLNLDGENKGSSPLSAEVLPGALQVFR